MTRHLSESLEAPEPLFRLGLRRLEAANGNPNTDIRFSTEVMHATKAKLRELGLDPHDTTARELYHALQQRILEDDKRLTRHFQTQAATHISAEADLTAGMLHVIKQLPDSKHCFALKNSRLRTLIKQLPPRKTIKKLGYRSLDSLLKHESPVLIVAAAWLVEGHTWQKRLLEHYKKLKPSDFEDRTIQLVEPTSVRWRKLAAEVVDTRKHNLLSFKELGALVFLPLPKNVPAGAVTVSFSLALHEFNAIRASSSFLKLCQVRTDFGQVVKTVALDEPRLSSEMLDEPVPWHLIQRYYARLPEQKLSDVFEPHLGQEDMSWQGVEETLAAIEPGFAFWQGTGHLGLLHDRQPVSLNIVDVALNLCNQVSFERRLKQYFQKSLWHELLLRYLRHDSVEQTVLTELQPKLATEKALA
jgi:hypothetical protein